MNRAPVLSKLSCKTLAWTVELSSGAERQLGKLDTSYGGGKTHGLPEFIDPARLPREPVTVVAFDGENADPTAGRRCS